MSSEFYGSVPETPVSPNRERKLNATKLLVTVFLVLVVAELIWAFRTLRPSDLIFNNSTNMALPTAVPTPSYKADLSLEGPTQAKVGATINVDIVQTSDSSTTGTDILVNYDPRSLELIPVNSKAATTVGKVYQEYPSNSADTKTGEISVSGIATNPSAPAFPGRQVLASLKFKAKVAGETDLKINFQPGSSGDSNVTSSQNGKDILSDVKGLHLNISK